MKNKFLNNFISPVSGRILSTHRYALVGDRNGIATPSPILIDMQLEIMRLQIEVEGMVTPVPIGSPAPEREASASTIRDVFNITEDVNWNNFKIVNVGYPDDPQDVATKEYVDSQISSSNADITFTSEDNADRINRLEQRIIALEQQLNR